MSEDTRDLKFKAEDITCSGCAMDMENILKEKEGIIDAKVDFSNNIIDVRHDPEKIDNKKVYIAVRKLGFRIKPVKD